MEKNWYVVHTYSGYENKVKATSDVIKAINEADLVILGIGSLFTSIIPNLLDEKVKQALKKSKAKKMYVCTSCLKSGRVERA